MKLPPLMTDEEKAADLAKRGGRMPSFMGNPCTCCWSMDELDEVTRFCRWCGRLGVKRNGFWDYTGRGEPLLRKALQQPIVKGMIHECVDPEVHAYAVVFLEHLFACNVIEREQLHDADKPTGFWWQATDDAWPNFDVEAALRKWCAWNFPDIAVPKFELKHWKPGENDG